MIERRCKPRSLVMDNGPEFAGRALDAWAYERHPTGLHPTGQADRKLFRRELQWEVPRRVPEPALVHEPPRRSAQDRGLARRLQPGAAAQLTGPTAARCLCRRGGAPVARSDLRPARFTDFPRPIRRQGLATKAIALYGLAACEKGTVANPHALQGLGCLIARKWSMGSSLPKGIRDHQFGAAEV